MNTSTIIVVGIFTILGIVGLLVLIITYLFLKEKFKATKFAVLNNLPPCDNIYCQIKILDLPIPKIQDNPNEFDRDMALFLGNLISITAYPKNGIIQVPNTLEILAELSVDSTSPTIGIICKSDNVIWIIFRGTKTLSDLTFDLTYQQKKFLFNGKQKSPNFFTKDIIVHSGFLQIYNKFRPQLLETLRYHKSKQTIIAGHSLGAAISQICTLDLQLQGMSTITYLFASPRVGNKSFVDSFKKDYPTFAIINNLDTIPTLPVSVCPNFRQSNSPYYYYNIGQEIRFSNNWKSLTNNHLMAIYMDFLSSY